VLDLRLTKPKKLLWRVGEQQRIEPKVACEVLVAHTHGLVRWDLLDWLGRRRWWDD